MDLVLDKKAHPFELSNYVEIRLKYQLTQLKMISLNVSNPWQYWSCGVFLLNQERTISVINTS